MTESHLNRAEAFWKNERIHIQVFFKSKIVWLSDFGSLIKIECDGLWRIKNAGAWFGVSVFVMFDVLAQFIQKTKGASIKYALESFPTGYKMISEGSTLENGCPQDVRPLESIEMVYFIKNWDRRSTLEEYLEECQLYWNLSPEIFPVRMNLRTLKVKEILKSINSQLEKEGVVEVTVKLSDLISIEFINELTTELSRRELSFEVSSDHRYLRAAI